VLRCVGGLAQWVKERRLEGAGHFLKANKPRCMNELTPIKANLTAKEAAIVHLIKQGLARKQIAAELNMSYGTLDTHFKHIFLKLDIHSVNELIVWAMRNNI
jgi:DNA-binding NarL/FixJ family response regulator